jgi:hypothetical protein
MTGRANRLIRRTTIGCVGMLTLIAATMSYLHMHLLVELHGQPGWVAALTPLSVDRMIVAASTTLLADSRNGNRGFLPWALGGDVTPNETWAISLGVWDGNPRSCGVSVGRAPVRLKRSADQIPNGW